MGRMGMSTRRSYQQGISTKTALIIGIIVFIAVIFVIEVVARQGRSSPDVSETSEQQQQGPVLSLSEWGVEVPLDDDSVPYSVFESNMTADGTVTQYSITFVGYDSLEGCRPSGPDASAAAAIGTIDVVRDGDATVEGSQAVVDGKTYRYTPIGDGSDSSWVCATTQEGKDWVLKAAREFPDLFKKLQKDEGN